MNKVLIMRTANIEVMDKLIDYLEKNNQKGYVYCLIQKSELKTFKEKYPYINYIEREDGFFKYKDFKKNITLRSRLKKIKFDNLYIPSSYIDYPGFEDIFMITSKINANNYILFNSLSEIQKIKLNNIYFIYFLLLKNSKDIIFFIRILFNLTKITLTYITTYPYYFFKNKRNKTGEKI